MTAGSGGTARVQLHAIAGLASTHTAPFARLIHDDVIARRYRGSGNQRQKIVGLELPEDQALPTTRKRSHHVHNAFTAQWDADEPCTANLPFDVDWVEVQVWNRFVDVAVFLGSTKISLHESRRSIGQPTGDQDERKQAVSMRTLWYPLDSGGDLVSSTRRAFHLSVQLSLSWHPLDERATRIQKQIAERRERRRQPVASAEAGEVLPLPVVVDPSFRFVEPSRAIEWSSIVAANVRRIFLQGDMDEIQEFYDDILHGDMEQEIEDDDAIAVDEGHLTAFRLCQLSAQYLDHCVTVLDARKDEYTDLYRSLASARRDRRRDHKDLVDHRRRLQKELDELNLLSTTYEKLLEHHGKSVDTICRTEIPTSGTSGRDTADAQAPFASHSREIADVVSKKPAFLMTWEEREQATKEHKELDKARRIEDEKVRLQRLFQERQDRESLELRLSTLAQRRRQRSARVLQATIRSFLIRLRLQRASAFNRAAQMIQAHARRYLSRKNWPQTRLLLVQAREQRLMGECDRESAIMRQRERDEEAKQRAPVRDSLDPGILSDDNDSMGSPNAKPVEALELVAMWKKLKRILTLACEKGAHPAVVFAKLDSRGDGVVDRAEFRLGVRHFGIRMDRRMTRAIIALARAKGEDPPRPLTLTVAQFVRGFELPILETTPVRLSPVPVQEPRTLQESIDSSPSKARSASTRDQRSRDSAPSKDDVADRETSQMIEQVAEAVSSLRRRVLRAAQDHLAAKRQSTTDYFVFRAALTHVFEEFDVDGNGELDLPELVECMAAINFRVTPENLAIVRECFVTDPTSESVSIAEFISFALAGMQTSDNKPADEELGILGYRLRDAILGKVKIARKQTDSIEEAVRLVFKSAYTTKTQKSCPRRDFARVLASLRLGFTPAQLSRLVLRLDQDGDNTVSFDEVLTWLRLRTNSEAAGSVRTPDAFEKRENRYSETVGFIRAIFTELAGASDPTMPRKHRADSIVSLFRRIDRNGSKKIHASELEVFLSGIDLADLQVVRLRDDEADFEVNAAQLAKETVKLIDLNGNGVVTLEEWTGFMLEDSTGDHRRGERYAIVEGVRDAMRIKFGDENELLDWFRSIPGSIGVDKTRPGAEKKVRTREFKNAMRAKLPSLDPKDLDEALKILDADGSGWITEKELYEWQFPTRDIEELVALISQEWTTERQNAKHRDLSDDTFVDALYRRFDHDGNGLIARAEVREGFRSFRISLNDDELVLLVGEFDADHDGFWRRAEFAACVSQLLRSSSTSQAEAARYQTQEQYSSDSQQDDEDGGYDSPDPDFAENEGTHDPKKSVDEDEDDLYSLGEMSPPAMSPIQFDEGAVARTKQQRTTGVEYSEDFDEDA